MVAAMTSREMKDSDKIKMYLNIGEQRISMTVPFANQDFVREVEEKVDGLYHQWRIAFPKKTNREILTMVAFQYASYYEELLSRQAEALAGVEECLQLIDSEAKESDKDAEADTDPEDSEEFIPDFFDR